MTTSAHASARAMNALFPRACHSYRPLHCSLLDTENGFVTRAERFRDFGTEHEGDGALTSLDETSPT
ncbi:unnamed protein product [Parnassius mnemosyne]|uniref:Uncharacterized protein n=1 Tax=Parnassius mnemosyne TaxID=213953 RepID=A0AAV1KGT7_9NEOP